MGFAQSKYVYLDSCTVHWIKDTFLNGSNDLMFLIEDFLRSMTRGPNIRVRTEIIDLIDQCCNRIEKYHFIFVDDVKYYNDRLRRHSLSKSNSSYLESQREYNIPALDNYMYNRSIKMRPHCFTRRMNHYYTFRETNEPLINYNFHFSQCTVGDYDDLMWIVYTLDGPVVIEIFLREYLNVIRRPGKFSEVSIMTLAINWLFNHVKDLPYFF